jgi:hypothetical protein
MTNIRDKSWLWNLTFPFAHNNVTAWDGVIYKPKGFDLSVKLVEHENIHLRQQERVGKWKFLFLYLFMLPFFVNPWRRDWEIEAYVYGSGLSEDEAKVILKSYKYGWLNA